MTSLIYSEIPKCLMNIRIGDNEQLLDETLAALSGQRYPLDLCYRITYFLPGS